MMIRHRSPAFLSSVIREFYLVSRFLFPFSIQRRLSSSFYSKLHYTVPDLIPYTGHSITDVASMPRTKTGGWFGGHVENLTAFSRCRNSPAHRPSLHRYLQHSRYIVDVCVLQVSISLSAPSTVLTMKVNEFNEFNECTIRMIE